MANTLLGKATIIPRGAYSAETEYYRLNLVTDSGNSYLYINPTPSTGVSLTETTHWQQIAEKGDTGDVSQAQMESAISAAVAPVTSQLLALPQNLITDKTLLYPCNDTAVWNAGGSTVLSTNTVEYKNSPASVLLSSETSLYINMYRGGLKSQSLLVGKAVFGVWVYIPDTTKIESMFLHLAETTAFTPTFSKSFVVNNARHFEDGWNWVVFTQADFPAVEGLAWEDVDAIRLQFVTVTVGEGTVSVGGIYYNVDVQPKIVLSFDDGDASVYNLVYPILRKAGISATAYTIQSRIGTTGYMTLQQLYDLYNNGWDIGNHTNDHTRLTELSTDEEIISKVVPFSEWLQERGFLRSAWHLAYPFGGYNANVISVLREAGIKTARATYDGKTYNAQGWMSIPNDISFSNTATIEGMHEKIDALKTWGGTLFAYGHIFTTDPSPDPYACEISILEDFVEYCTSQGVEILCTSEWYRRVANL